MPVDTSRVLVVIPAFREENRIGSVVSAVRDYVRDVLVIDDGSPDQTGNEAEQAGATVLRQDPNQGKGAALNRGFEYARDHGFFAVITMDADGQHAPGDLPGFLEAFSESGAQVIVGNRMAGAAGMPLIRRLTNRIMSWLLSRKAGQVIPDSQNGFRLYDTSVLTHVHVGAAGFAAESEILLRLASEGIRIESVPTQTIYGDEKSKINPVSDTCRFLRMLRRFDREEKRGGTSSV